MTRTAHVALYDTLADWEIGYLLVELRTGRFTDEPWQIVTVAASAEPITTMGGLRIVPDLALTDLDPAASDLLILPGADLWDDGGGDDFAAAAAGSWRPGSRWRRSAGRRPGWPAPGCWTGDGTPARHPSTSRPPGTPGGDHYVDQRAVVDGDLVTAGPQSPVQFARATLRPPRPGVRRDAGGVRDVFYRADPSGYLVLIRPATPDDSPRPCRRAPRARRLAGAACAERGRGGADRGGAHHLPAERAGARRRPGAGHGGRADRGLVAGARRGAGPAADRGGGQPADGGEPAGSTRVADLLVERGLAEYRTNPAHRRAQLLACTEAGYWAIRQISVVTHPWADRIGGQSGRRAAPGAGHDAAPGGGPGGRIVWGTTPAPPRGSRRWRSGNRSGEERAVAVQRGLAAEVGVQHGRVAGRSRRGRPGRSSRPSTSPRRPGR